MPKYEVRLYECMYIIDPTLEEAEVEDVQRGMEENITSLGGEVKAHYDWGRRPLMFRIRRRTEGLYKLLYFEAPGNVVEEFKHTAMSDERVIRMMVVVAQPEAIYRPPGEEEEEVEEGEELSPEAAPAVPAQAEAQVESDEAEEEEED